MTTRSVEDNHILQQVYAKILSTNFIRSNKNKCTDEDIKEFEDLINSVIPNEDDSFDAGRRSIIQELFNKNTIAFERYIGDNHTHSAYMILHAQSHVMQKHFRLKTYSIEWDDKNRKHFVVKKPDNIKKINKFYNNKWKSNKINKAYVTRINDFNSYDSNSDYKRTVVKKVYNNTDHNNDRDNDEKWNYVKEKGKGKYRRRLNSSENNSDQEDCDENDHSYTKKKVSTDHHGPKDKIKQKNYIVKSVTTKNDSDNENDDEEDSNKEDEKNTKKTDSGDKESDDENDDENDTERENEKNDEPNEESCDERDDDDEKEDDNNDINNGNAKSESNNLDGDSQNTPEKNPKNKSKEYGNRDISKGTKKKFPVNWADAE